MAIPLHTDVLLRGSEAWNAWRIQNPDVTPDLRSAALARLALSGADFANADLSEANLHGADLRGAKLDHAILREADLRDADLRDTDLQSVAVGPAPQMLAGTDLTGATLSAALTELYGNLAAAKDISDNAQKLFIAVLGACLYSWLTIGTTTDVKLLTNRGTSPLPIIQTTIPIASFYIVAPILLLGVFLYLHFYLQKLWEELGCLPAIFPDGRPLYAKADPWLLSDLVRSHFARLADNRPFLSHVQLWLSVLLAWCLVPITLILLWGRYLPRHDLAGTLFQSAIAAASIAAAITLYRIARATLRGAVRRRFNWKASIITLGAYRPLAIAIAVTVSLTLVAMLAIRGPRPSAMEGDGWARAHGVSNWVPNAFSWLGYAPYANLRGADISTKPASFSEKNTASWELVKEVDFQNADLRFADMRGAFLFRSILINAHLEGAHLLLSDLRQAEMFQAHLSDTDLTGANLASADLGGADLQRADLTGADMTNATLEYTNLANAIGLTPGQLNKSPTWMSAFYDADMLKKLGLPADNNELLKRRFKADTEALKSGDPNAARDARLRQLSRLMPAKAPDVAFLITHEAGTTKLEAVVPRSNPLKDQRPFTVPELARLYNFPLGLTGRGQVIGIIELAGGYRDQDLDRYFKDLGLARPSVSSISVDGAKNHPENSSNGADAQVEMDIEVAGSVAPGAQINVYFAGQANQGMVDAIKKAAADSASVLIIGWGNPEDDPILKSGLAQVNSALQAAAERGMTIVAASGDDGTHDRMSDGQDHVDFPAASPWVLGVGGTTLSASKGVITKEFVWNDAAAGGATGGGFSKLTPIPSWQSGLKEFPANRGGRGVPDVAASADPSAGYTLFIDGHYVVIGGTSAAGPLWGGLIALLNQGIGRNIGYFNPLLYTQVGPHGLMRPIAENRDTSAHQGWNPGTGWGSPDGAALLEYLKANLKDVRTHH